MSDGCLLEWNETPGQAERVPRKSAENQLRVLFVRKICAKPLLQASTYSARPFVMLIVIRHSHFLNHCTSVHRKPSTVGRF